MRLYGISTRLYHTLNMSLTINTIPTTPYTGQKPVCFHSTNYLTLGYNHTAYCNYYIFCH